jgi:hypothetical protein
MIAVVLASGVSELDTVWSGGPRRQCHTLRKMYFGYQIPS